MDSGGGEGVQGQAGQHIKDNYNKNYSFKNILKINQVDRYYYLNNC